MRSFEPQLVHLVVAVVVDEVDEVVVDCVLTPKVKIRKSRQATIMFLWCCNAKADFRSAPSPARFLALQRTNE